MSAAARPLGVVTRGTTNPNRLRRFDRWIVHRAGGALRRTPDAVVVDLGYGASPVTTLELADRLARAVGRPVPVVGLEIDPDRVAAAQPFARPEVEFRGGGFEVPLPGGTRPLLIRAANVLRQYDEEEVQAAWAAMAGRLVEPGVLVEGTCDELGRLASWVTIPAPAADSQDEVVPESLTISVDLRFVDSPGRIAERLPKALIHRNVPGERVHHLMLALDHAWKRAAPRGVFGPRQRWRATVELLAAEGWPVLDGPVRWRLGELSVPWTSVAPGRAATCPGSPPPRLPSRPPPGRRTRHRPRGA